MSIRSLSTIDATSARLREIAMAAEAAEFLGSEEALVEKLGVSRATTRQAARLLEREGLLRVRRGLNGGYFAARPNLNTVELAVSGYLDTLDMETEDVTVIASVLWVEAMRRAASVRTDAANAMAEMFRKRVLALRPNASFADVLKIENESRAAIFDLTKARYIELIFQINIAFSRKRFSPASVSDHTESHARFVDAWRKAKMMEMNAISDGDPELGMMAARHIRNLWHQRIWSTAVAHGETDAGDATAAVDAPDAAQAAAMDRV